MGFMDKLKQKAQEYDLQGKAGQLADGIEKTGKQAAEKAGEIAHENRAKVASGLDKAGAKFDEQTDGKYTDKVAKAKGMATKAVDRVAEQRPDAASGAGAPTDTTPGSYAAPAPTTPDDVTEVPPTAAGPSGATPPPGPQDPSI
ncbi:Rv0909 family putative TA system antitoxin [Dermatophilaceae bacterium Soc4.6]